MARGADMTRPNHSRQLAKMQYRTIRATIRPKKEAESSRECTTAPWVHARGVTSCGPVGGRGAGNKTGFTAEKSVERKVIAEQTGKCDTGLRAPPWKRRI